MTTDTDKAPPAEQDEEQSVLPTVLAGAGILAVAALLIFWPSDDDAGKAGAGGGKANAAASAKGGGADGPRGRAAGVGARPSDAATTPPGSSNRNPAIKFPSGGGGMAPMPEVTPKDPPPDASTGDKIAFYEKRLETALRVQDSRKKFTERLAGLKERIEASPNPEQGMRTYERRKEIVEENYDKAKKDVADIEAKLAELRG